MTCDRRLKLADMVSRGMKPKEIADELGYASPGSVSSALMNPDVKEQIAWHRDNLFEKSRIDRVTLLRDLYESVTCPTGPIFKTLQGDDSNNSFLLASNLDKLDDVQSKLIQQVEMGSTLVQTGTDEEGEPTFERVATISKLKFHSPDAARKILAKAAGFEDGLPKDSKGEGQGPFRGMIIIPPGSEPKETTAPE